MHGVEIEGVIEPAVEMALRAKPRRLGIIGGRRTILSRTYPKKLSTLDAPIFQRIAQPLSALIESGDVNSPEFAKRAEQILLPLKGCSHVLLACTHYGAAIDSLRKVIGEKVEFLDPADAVVEAIQDSEFDKGSSVFMTTGNAAAMIRSARLAFDVEIGEASTVEL